MRALALQDDRPSDVEPDVLPRGERETGELGTVCNPPQRCDREREYRQRTDEAGDQHGQRGKRQALDRHGRRSDRTTGTAATRRHCDAAARPLAGRRGPD
ncbi:MAG: hypothetical protein ABIR79_15585, partial [Candidatus Binatia bacterium]